ncbi:MAG: anti-sigma factor antagonist [Nitrosomonadales bacterium]|nr:MAG: anti-sigma factor antagonist [Nitrosomonadales bacterium]
MSIIATTKNGVFIAMPDGRLDTNTSPEAEQLIMAAIENGENKIVIDFSKTDYISSSGLRVILKTAKVLKPKNGKAALCNTNKQIHEVLEISGFLGVLKSFDSLDEAMTFVNS